MYTPKSNRYVHEGKKRQDLYVLHIGNFLKICGLSLPFNAKDIISAQGTINNVLIILKYYIYVCRGKCRDPDLEGGLEFLKYAINIEKASMIYLSPVQKEL
jgi:hypothetical protein